MACRKEEIHFSSMGQRAGNNTNSGSGPSLQAPPTQVLYGCIKQMDKVMGESSAAGSTRAGHLWLRKLLEKCHTMLAAFLCLWSPLLVGYSIMAHMFILQLEIMFALNVQMSSCIVSPFWLTEKMFSSGSFSISRYSEVRWYFSFWSLIDSLRGKSFAFVLLLQALVGPSGKLLWWCGAR